MLNFFDLPKTLVCRAVAIDVASGIAARYWECRAVSTAVPTNTTPASAVSILTKEGQIVCLIDERCDYASKILSIVQDYSSASALSRKEVLKHIVTALRSWSEQYSECEHCNATILIVQPNGIATLTLGKAQIRAAEHRLRLRNVLSVGSVKDFVQDRIKSRLEAKTTGEALYYAEDWSWQNDEDRFICRFEERTMQGVMRLVALASDMWLPTDVEVITRAGLEKQGSLKAASEAMRAAFMAIGEQPRGSLAVLDIMPQELDSPDTDNALDIMNKITKSFKALKSASILGVGLGKFTVISLIVGLIVYGAWNVYQNKFSDNSQRADSSTFLSQRSTDALRKNQISKSDTVHLNAWSKDDEDSDMDTSGLNTISNVANSANTTILAFEKSSRTIVPILLKTPPRLAESNLLSKVRVEISGPQRVSKYRIEADTAKRQLQPNTTRFNVVIEEPLAKGMYTVKLSYAAEEISSSASVSVNVIQIPQTSTKFNDGKANAASTFSAISSTRTFYFGTQMVMGNKQLALLRKRTEFFLGGNLEGVLADMSFAYRFITRSGDTTATQHFPFDDRTPRGIQYGLYISSSIATIETWINYRYPNGTNSIFGHTQRNVQQMPPSILSDKVKIAWAYKPRTTAKSSEYRPNDIEVSISGLVIDVSDVPVDNIENGSQPVYATLNSTHVPIMPSVREQREFIQRSIAEAKLGYSSSVVGVTVIPSYTVLSIYNSDDQQIVPENASEIITIVPISSTFDRGQYTCKVLIRNLPTKPRNEDWRLIGQIVINPNASITNPLNAAISQETIDMDTFIPISIEYK